MDILTRLAGEFSLQKWQVENIVGLLDEDNTIPFIARYRKEQTGEVDDQKLRELTERLGYMRNLEERKALVLKTIEEQGKLTEEISGKVAAAATLAEVEDIYRPYKPKRRTRATIAMEKGLGPLADLVWAQELSEALEAVAAGFVNAELGVESTEDALAGASDIIAEKISDDATCRALVRQLTFDNGIISSAGIKKAIEAQAKEAAKADAKDSKLSVYEMYYEFSEPIKKIAGHRVLAINRGENEGFLKINTEAPEEKILEGLRRMFVKESNFTRRFMENSLDDSYKRLIAPAVEREVRTALTEQAEEGAIKVFGENLRQLLMQPPIKGQTVLAIDPGFRTGCKLAVVDETGKVLETGVVYPTIGKDTAPSKRTMSNMVKRHKVSVIAIGNGTASRETETVVAEMLKEMEEKAQYVIVNEAGASVYSASKLGAEEFPEFDVSLRSAVSIGRRLQDPLAELVKIDPRSIGVGQYQHDMNQKRLSGTLAGVVEDCVNAVGVDLNTASPSLLAYVAGISPAVAKNILAYREKSGKFSSRDELLKVSKLGPKAFLQCAGFLRIADGAEPLDNTGVHPESYTVAKAFMSLKDVPVKQQGPVKSLKSLGAASGKPQVDFTAMAKKLEIGIPTLKDIAKELEKPGRDPRDELPPVLLRGDVLDMKDLTEGMMLKGTVRNVIDFGVFVDIGVHQDGLVHISEVADKFIKHPLEVVKVGDVVNVKVLGVDMAKKRISLSMKGAK